MKRIVLLLVLLLGTVNLFGGANVAAYLKCSCGKEISADSCFGGWKNHVLAV